MIQSTLAESLHGLDEVREAPDRPGNGGRIGWIAVCACGVEGWPMQGPDSAARWLRRMHIDREVAA